MRLRMLLSVLLFSGLTSGMVVAGESGIVASDMKKNNSCENKTIQSEGGIVASEAKMANSCAGATTESDGEIIGWIETVDKNEIAAANLALRNNVDKSVKKYAHFMISQHSKNLKEMKKISHQINVPATQPKAVKQLEEQGKQDIAKLQTLHNQDFQTAYIDAMVKGHQDVLKTINDTYLKTVNNPTLKKLLEDTRKHVEKHLQLARELQGKMANHT